MNIQGGQKLYIGDSRQMDQICDESVDFIITSPPYWNLKDYSDHAESIGTATYEEYLSDLDDVWAECFRVAKKDAVMVINVNSRRHKKKFYPIAIDIASRMQNWHLHDLNIWYVPNALPQPNHYIERLLDNKFEYLLVFTKGDADSYEFHKPRVPQKYAVADPRAHKKNQNGRCLGNILRIPAYRPPNVKKLNYHVAAYPEELVSFFLEAYTSKGDSVLDPFAGSGTTLKVSRAMERCGIGYELNEEYRPLIETRIAETWQVPDWKQLDILHSATMQTGSARPRKAQFTKADDERFDGF